MLSINADVNAKDRKGSTPLIRASEKGYAEVVRLLLNSKADIKTYNISKENALFMACLKGHYDCVRAIIAHSSFDICFFNNPQNFPG